MLIPCFTSTYQAAPSWPAQLSCHSPLLLRIALWHSTGQTLSDCCHRCNTPETAVIATIATVLAYYHPKAYIFPATIVAGGVVTFALGHFRRQPVPRKMVGRMQLPGRHCERQTGLIALL